jgi:NADH dehydrogenase [ubiquinone] 1 alpha subcomplex assembly factor 7
MTDLRQRIAEAIRVNGPMPVSLYMLMCLHDPRDGYYATRPAFNQDFTTAPETTQVFGELLGLWAAHEWMALGKPAPIHLIELGPGRGVMMADALRAAASVPGFLDAAQIHLVEASPALRAEQAKRLEGHAIQHHDDLDDVPPGPSIILANEFLDCLAIRQFVREGDGWRERQVGLDTAGNLAFGIGPPADLPGHVIPAADEAEVAPALDGFADAVARRLLAHPGRALLLDYGPADHTPGDTLRAYKAGKQISPLADPGASDLTADVDFARLRALCEAHGLAVHGPISQQYFLARLGARHRAESLSRANPARAEEIRAAVTKLLDPDEMGARFRAIALSPPGAEPPPGF